MEPVPQVALQNGLHPGDFALRLHDLVAKRDDLWHEPGRTASILAASNAGKVKRQYATGTSSIGQPLDLPSVATSRVWPQPESSTEIA